MSRQAMSTIALAAALAACVPGALAEPPVIDGTLAAADGADIHDWELATLVETFIGNAAGVDYESMIFGFTECYGGDKFDDFAGFGNTALLAGGAPGTTTVYNGYHRGLAVNLVPGNTTNGAHSGALAWARPGDSPIVTGPNVQIGGSASTHVLVWAGKPEGPDYEDILDVQANFGGQPNTTVTVLAGDGSDPLADGPATYGGLVDALRTIGTMMNQNEQFVFFGTDHGGYAPGESYVSFEPGDNTVETDLAAYDAMLADPGNEAYVALWADQPIDAAWFDSVSVNACELNTPFDTWAELDLDDDGSIDTYKYLMSVEESILQETGNQITFAYNGIDTLNVARVTLNSGAIARVPEPASALLLIAGGLAGLARRTRPRHPFGRC